MPFFQDEANKTAKEEKIAKQHREDEAATGLDADRKRAKKTVLEKAEEGIQEVRRHTYVIHGQEASGV